MAEQPASVEPRISLEAIRKLDEFARDFRGRLRERAGQLSRADGSGVVIGEETVRGALPFVCRELLSLSGGNPDNQRGSDEQRPEAA